MSTFRLVTQIIFELKENEVSQLSARRFVEELAICQDCGLSPGLSTTCPGNERTKLAS